MCAPLLMQQRVSDPSERSANAGRDIHWQWGGHRLGTFQQHAALSTVPVVAGARRPPMCGVPGAATRHSDMARAQRNGPSGCSRENQPQSWQAVLQQTGHDQPPRAWFADTSVRPRLHGRADPIIVLALSEPSLLMHLEGP